MIILRIVIILIALRYLYCVAMCYRNEVTNPTFPRDVAMLYFSLFMFVLSFFIK